MGLRAYVLTVIDKREKKVTDFHKSKQYLNLIFI